MRTLVTGATGFIGPPLVRRLVERGDDVRVLVRRNGDAHRVTGLPVQMVEGDVSHSESLPAALAGVERVFHAAGLVSFARRDRHRLHQANVEGTRNVLAAALAAGVQRVVLTSSISAVGYSRRPVLMTEQSEWVDYGISYARSKRRAEDEAFALYRRGLPLVIVNPTMAMGPDDPKLTATAPIAKYLRGQIRAYVRGGLNVIDVEDFAAGHILADERGRLGERYILGGTNLTWTQFFGMLHELTGLGRPWPVPFAVGLALASLLERVVAARTGKPPAFHVEEVRAAGLYRLADASKAVRELGLPRRPLRETLVRTIDWMERSGIAGVPKGR